MLPTIALNPLTNLFSPWHHPVPDLLRKLASYSAQKEEEYRKQWALATSYLRNLPGFPVESWPMFRLLAPKTYQFLQVAYTKLSLDSSAQYCTSWEAKSCSCVLFTTARLPCRKSNAIQSTNTAATTFILTTTINSGVDYVDYRYIATRSKLSTCKRLSPMSKLTI